MPSYPQEEPLDIGGNIGWCRCCRNAVCCVAWGCASCHQTHPPAGRADDQPGHLCHGWYATGSFTDRWLCPTCGKVLNGYP